MQVTLMESHMKIKTELENLKEKDIYSLMLFALYKAQELPEYSSLSQLAYILDKDNLLKLCEFYGGLTIRIPTVKELELLVYGLLMFQRIDIEKEDYRKVYDELKLKEIDSNHIKDTYFLIKELLADYNFDSGRT